MDTDGTLPFAVRRAIEDALTTRFAATVRVIVAANIPYSQVFRCALKPPAGAVPGTVIVRIPRDQALGRSGAAPLELERASLEFLADVGSGLGPRFIAGGGDAGFVASEDMGPHPSLLDIFLRDDADAAVQGALAFARAIGMLHAQTAPHAVSACGRGCLQQAPVTVATHWQEVKEALARLGLPAPRGVDQDVEAVTLNLAQPGDYLALSSGDLSVVNCKVADGTVRFFDFEAGCFRHALIDAALFQFFYPTGGPAWRMPHGLSDRLESAYRAELVRACPAASDDSNYLVGMAATSAAWMIIRMARLARVDAGPDRDPWPILPSGWCGPIPSRSRRRQLVSILDTTVASVKRSHALGALAGWCERMADTLRTRWPQATEDLPLYPAFHRPNAD